MGKKRILQINKLYYPYVGGIERVVQQIAEGLADKTDMKVLVSSEKKKLIEEEINGVQVIRVPSIAMVGNLPVPLGLTKKLRSLRHEVDVIHLHMPYPFGDLACLLSNYKGKIVVWWHSDVVRQKKMMLLYKPIMNRMLKRADVIIVATKGHIEGSEYLKPFRDKCIIVPFGVDQKIEYEADKYIVEPKEQECETSKVQFLFIGRLIYYKGCKVLLEAFKDVENAKLTMVGSGDMEQELKDLAKSYHIEDKVDFCGEVAEEELYEHLKSCDVFVLPSIVRSEAFGLVQIEAMAFGKPVINTNLPSGVPYVSLDKITGLTVPPEDVQALAKAMQWLVDHEEERNEMGRMARKRMKEEYRMETMLERVFEVYETL
ncbi:glycosyltransferase [Anaerosporobacter sp.]|uniref:glycosyltransferase n=1 Tax=Anaerosporobacter sp. TaxID=1872529 RepID=UPI00286F6589|nr:glycosyltransferase [Anaerosporobacter sp.]